MSDRLNVSARSAEPRVSHTAGTVTAASTSPTSRPVKDSSRKTRRIGTPTERPRMTSASVWVPTASAM